MGTLVPFGVRKDAALIFDETFAIEKLGSFLQDQSIQSSREFFQHYWTDIWLEPADGPVRRPLQTSYRPLQVLTVCYKILNHDIFARAHNTSLLINCLLLGLAGGLLYLTGLALTKDHIISAGAAYLMMFSMAALTSTWVALTGEHALVPLLMSAAILLYLKYKEKGGLRYLLPMGLIFFVGPMYKEYLCITVFIFWGAELCAPKRSKAFLALLCVATFHAVFPSFIVNVLCYQNMILKSPFSSHTGSVVAGKSFFKFQFINFFFFSITPTIAVLGCFAVLLRFIQRYPRWKKLILVLGCFLIGALFISDFRPVFGWFVLALLLFVTGCAWRIHRVLFFWLLIGWLPYLKVYYIEAHLMYAIMPLALVLLWHIKQQWFSGDPKGAEAVSVVKKILLVFLCLAFIDQGLNLLSAKRGFEETTQLAQQVARDIATRMDQVSREKNILISNTLLGKDIAFYLRRNHQKVLDLNGFTVWRNSLKEEEMFLTPEAFAEVVARQDEQTRIFLLDEDAYPSRMTFFIRTLGLELKPLRQRQTNVRYPYVDVLKYFVPVLFTSYPGTPDIIDFAFMGKGLFYRKLYGGQYLFVLESSLSNK
jgi:hypothetical protein